MNSIIRAREIRDRMTARDGQHRTIYYDKKEKCFRVMTDDRLYDVQRVYGKIYEKVE